MTYYALWPNNSIGKTFANLSMTLSIFAEHGFNKATGGKVSYYVCICYPDHVQCIGREA